MVRKKLKEKLENISYQNENENRKYKNFWTKVKVILRKKNYSLNIFAKKNKSFKLMTFALTLEKLPMLHSENTFLQLSSSYL